MNAHSIIQGCTNAGVRSPWRLNFIRLWVLSIEVASCHPCGTESYDVASRFLECLFTPRVSET